MQKKVRTQLNVLLFLFKILSGPGASKLLAFGGIIILVHTVVFFAWTVHIVIDDQVS